MASDDTEAWLLIGDHEDILVSAYDLEIKSEQSLHIAATVAEIKARINQIDSESRNNDTTVSSLRRQLQKLTFAQTKHLDPDAIACSCCGLKIAVISDIVSRSYRGQSGPAILLRNATNVNIGEKYDQILLTGLYTTASASCEGCGKVLGWAYIHARNFTQRFKEGMFCLEKAYILEHVDNLKLVAAN